MVRVVLEDLIDSFPRKKKVFTRERLITAASVASQLLSLVVFRRPALVPLQQALTALLAPSKNPGVPVEPSSVLLTRIRRLKVQIASAEEEDLVRLNAQLDVLMSLLLEDAEANGE